MKSKLTIVKAGFLTLLVTVFITSLSYADQPEDKGNAPEMNPGIFKHDLGLMPDPVPGEPATVPETNVGEAIHAAGLTADPGTFGDKQPAQPAQENVGEIMKKLGVIPGQLNKKSVPKMPF